MKNAYLPASSEVRTAAYALAAQARTPANAAGRISTDEVRAFLVRSTKKTVDGICVAGRMRELFGTPTEGRYQV